MTVGMARRFGDRMLIATDTMIHDEATAKRNLIPGRVKAIVLCEDVSVAYAGTVGYALPAIQEAAAIARGGRRIEDVIRPLRNACAESAARGEKFQTEFLVASHRSRATMFKIWKDGLITENNDRLWIGQPDVVTAIESIEAETPTGLAHSTTIPFMPPEEHRFTSAINQIATQPARFLSSSVGGFMITVLASPFGHTYQHIVGATMLQDIEFDKARGEEQHAEQQTGINYYTYQILANFWRGAAVVAAYLEQPRLGFLYRPLEWDGVETFRETTAEELLGRVREVATAMGAVERI
ncbi:hypothetical protein [Bradyrhizobium betae]|uniref:Uncharacterized protein n=1 Tax=Bradyrhizobium betae TaxID=244734 RepID=A0A5P6P2X3_9BRAD|nr:hypothetical protein [Bradyrhizobium betae]MCS3728732.1 hypothetical protein [Bradyrhizobium betae]QFI72621.1 hypothetical protein F8237_09610 [Bradyrhizobium betae]